MTLPFTRTAYNYQSHRYDLMQRAWAEFVYFELLPIDLRRCRVCSCGEYKDCKFAGNPNLNTFACYNCVLTRPSQKEVWVESDYHEHEINGNLGEYEMIYSAPSPMTEQLKACDTCPNCLEAKLEPTTEEFDMPHAILMKHAKAELKCPKCKAMYWRSK